MKMMYSTVMEPILLYGSEFWGHSLTSNEKMRAKWRGLQRRLLIKTVKAYRTVSHEALWIVPLDLTIKERIDIQQDIINGGDKIIYKIKTKEDNKH